MNWLLVLQCSKMGYKVASILYIHHCSKVIGISKKTLFERMFLFSLQLFLHRIYRLMTSVIIKRNVLHVLLLAVTRVLVTLPHFFFIRTGVACFQKSQTLTRHSTSWFIFHLTCFLVLLQQCLDSTSGYSSLTQNLSLWFPCSCNITTLCLVACRHLSHFGI